MAAELNQLLEHRPGDKLLNAVACHWHKLTATEDFKVYDKETSRSFIAHFTKDHDSATLELRPRVTSR